MKAKSFSVRCFVSSIINSYSLLIDAVMQLLSSLMLSQNDAQNIIQVVVDSTDLQPPFAVDTQPPAPHPTLQTQNTPSPVVQTQNPPPLPLCRLGLPPLPLYRLSLPLPLYTLLSLPFPFCKPSARHSSCCGTSCCGPNGSVFAPPSNDHSHCQWRGEISAPLQWFQFQYPTCGG
jgi:hypothetical protein